MLIVHTCTLSTSFHISMLHIWMHDDEKLLMKSLGWVETFLQDQATNPMDHGLLQLCKLEYILSHWWYLGSPLIFWTPFNFPILPSMVVVQDRQVMPSMRIFSNTTLPELRELAWSVEVLPELGSVFSISWILSTLTRAGTNMTLRFLPSPFSLASSTPLTWQSWETDTALQLLTGNSLVSVWTTVVGVAFVALDSKPMSSIASAKDFGVWCAWSNITVAILCSKDTYSTREAEELGSFLTTRSLIAQWKAVRKYNTEQWSLCNCF